MYYYNWNNLTLGQLKDGLAVFGFLILIGLTLTCAEKKWYAKLILVFFIIGFIIDGLFTYHLHWHHQKLSLITNHFLNKEYCIF